MGNGRPAAFGARRPLHIEGVFTPHMGNGRPAAFGARRPLHREGVFTRQFAATALCRPPDAARAIVAVIAPLVLLVCLPADGAPAAVMHVATSPVPKERLLTRPLNEVPRPRRFPPPRSDYVARFRVVADDFVDRPFPTTQLRGLAVE